jgi:type I restriction enzyme S subunit
MSAVATGTSDSMRNISQDKVRRLSLWLPPASEQRRIVAEVERQFSIVDAMEYAIEGGQKRARGLRQAILREAFTGRLAPQDPSDEPASALLERIRGQRVGA